MLAHGFAPFAVEQLLMMDAQSAAFFRRQHPNLERGRHIRITRLPRHADQTTRLKAADVSGCTLCRFVGVAFLKLGLYASAQPITKSRLRCQCFPQATRSNGE